MHTENPLLFKVELGVRYHPDYQEGLPDGPCIEAKIVGVFSCPEEMEEAKRFPMVRYNGSLILYGLLRGQVATVTGSFPTGKLTLPSFNMMEVLKMNDDRSKEKSKGPAIPKKRLPKSGPSKPVKSRGKSK
ncbi:MAG: hypothetical protein JJU11_03820 [Candidatus Sumerlaeia bacterium]|nr:hypothetical protein [Candidatus Sumerlaeia bacterium]